MCSSFFLASGSLFLGQPQVFPAWFNASPLPFLLAFAPIMALVYWMAKTRLSARRGGQAEAVQPAAG